MSIPADSSAFFASLIAAFASFEMLFDKAQSEPGTMCAALYLPGGPGGFGFPAAAIFCPNSSESPVGRSPAMRFPISSSTYSSIEPGGMPLCCAAAVTSVAVVPYAECCPLFGGEWVGEFAPLPEPDSAHGLVRDP